MNSVKKPTHAMRRTVLFVVLGSLLAFSSLQITGCKKSDPPPNNNPNATPNLQLVADNLVSPLSVTEAPMELKGYLLLIKREKYG
jgi:hypothetical protein